MKVTGNKNSMGGWFLSTWLSFQFNWLPLTAKVGFREFAFVVTYVQKKREALKSCFLSSRALLGLQSKKGTCFCYQNLLYWKKKSAFACFHKSESFKFCFLRSDFLSGWYNKIGARLMLRKKACFPHGFLCSIEKSFHIWYNKLGACYNASSHPATLRATFVK